MKILIAPDKFKGTMTAHRVADVIAVTIKDLGLGIAVDTCPIADGGEGTVDALVAATRGRLCSATVTGPLPGTTVEARYGVLGDGRTAVVEMAAASGLALLTAEQQNPELTTTFGTGELLREAWFEPGVRELIVGIGGSATTDGGVGCAQAWGNVTFEVGDGTTRGRDDSPLTGGDLSRIRRIMRVECGSGGAREGSRIRVACDVDNPLYGPRGAARVFGPQKGATAEQVERLDTGLRHMATLVERDLERHGLAHDPGAGAAGGLGFGLMAFLGATLHSGFDMVADAVGLDNRIAAADLVITGEGRLDGSSLGGKTAIGVARRCRAAGVPCVALCGSVDPPIAILAQDEGLTAAFSLCPGPLTLAEATAHGPGLLRHLTRQVMQVAMCLARR